MAEKRGKKEEKVTPVEEEETKNKEPDFDFLKLLESPIAASLLEGGKDLFKKKEVDPNMCEITIKAPSEVVLELFNIKKK